MAEVGRLHKLEMCAIIGKTEDYAGLVGVWEASVPEEGVEPTRGVIPGRYPIYREKE